MGPSPTVHASCVVVGEAGVLVRGPSGAGKSSFSAALIDHARALGRFSRLVADDRVRLAEANGRLVASPPAAIAGLIERRGLGILTVPHLPRVVVRIVVDIKPSIERLPEAAELFTSLAGVRLPRLSIARGAPDAPALAMTALANVAASRDCGAGALAFDGQHGEIAITMAATSKSRSNDARAASIGQRSERNEFCAETQ